MGILIEFAIRHVDFLISFPNHLKLVSDSACFRILQVFIDCGLMLQFVLSININESARAGELLCAASVDGSCCFAQCKHCIRFVRLGRSPILCTVGAYVIE